MALTGSPAASRALGIPASVISKELRWVDKPNGLAFLDVTLTAVPPDGDYVTAERLGGVQRIISVLGATLLPDEGPSQFGSFAKVLCTISTDVPDANDTVVIDGLTYTWKAAPSAAYEIDIGANIATCVTNLIAAINASGTAGTEYGTGTLRHPSVKAVAASAYGGSNTASLWIVSRTPGAAGNGIVCTETGDELAFAAGTLSGGRDPVSPSRRGEWARVFPNSQTESVTEDDLGDAFLLHSGPAFRSVRTTLLVQL